MTQAESNNITLAPAVSTRRRFLLQAAGAATGSTILALATVSTAECEPAPVAFTASPSPDPIFALIARHRAEEQAYGEALVARDELQENLPEEIRRRPRVQLGMKDGEPYFLHTHKQIDARLEWIPDFVSTPEIRARLHKELARDMNEVWAKRDEHGITAAEDLVGELCDSCQELEWALANTMPTSIAGVAALLRYANECEDQGEEWPDTDTIGPDGWHYQLRQTAARALEGLLGDARA
ncbi:hypothetical protein [Bradyrhizobium diazoefficiens]|uniref:hypothetical protein n=1 Tax=Bradyrhizobium diazoefficiens TaxID=1355477 RepID=UPI00272A8420|nr:hypothetical protein [Bradyrhizobium diazoefficiens]WLA62361.1 hypothetical protein QNN01_28260 [Bradyrhizobium diazoefficiens]